MKGRKNKEIFAAIESDLLGILKTAGRQGITAKELTYRMKISTATLYKHLNHSVTVERVKRGRWRLKSGPTHLLGPVDSDVVEQLFSHEGLVPGTIFEGENPKIPFQGRFDGMLADHPVEWLDTEQRERKLG